MAILSGIITGVLAQTSFLADTIFTDITVTYEWWVFFLISQTLVFVVEWLLVKEFYFSYWYRWIEIVLWTAPDALLVWLGYINQEGILGDVIQALPIRLLCFVGSHIVSFLFKIRLFICLRSCFVQALFWFYVLREKSIDCWLCCVFTILLVVTACFVIP